MRYRTLGSSGIRVSAIGFGAWGIGGRTGGATSYGETDDAVSERALAEAYDRGITFYDTANVYGDGHSEALIGQTFRGRRDRVVIATKAGMLPSYLGSDFSPAALRRSLEGSLRQLKTDYVDVLQLHNPVPSQVLGSPDIVDTLRAFRSEGKIRAYGYSAKTPTEALLLLADSGVTCLQINLNLLDWRAIDNGLIDAAAVAKVGLIARTPLAFGFLTGRISNNATFSEGDHRSQWSRERISTWIKAAEAAFAAFGTKPTSRSQAALRFCLSFAAVSTAIPGILTPAEVAENAPAGDLDSLSTDQMHSIERIYRTYQENLVNGPDE